MRVRFEQAGTGDTAEHRVSAQLMNVLGSTIAHSSTQTADELINEVGQRTTIGYATLNALRNELPGWTGGLLSVSIGRAGRGSQEPAEPGLAEDGRAVA